MTAHTGWLPLFSLNVLKKITIVCITYKFYYGPKINYH